MDMCSDCGNGRFVDYHGDYTCTYCGLVKYTHMVDDQAEWRCFDTEDQCKIRAEITFDDGPQTTIPDIKLQRAQQIAFETDTFIINKKKKKLLSVILKQNDIDNCLTNLATEWFEITLDNLLNTSKHKLIKKIMCLSAFAASCFLKRGFLLEYFENIFGLPLYASLEALIVVQDAWKGKPWYNQVLISLHGQAECISRTVYNLDCLPKESNFDIIKSAKQVHNKIKSLKGISSIKTNTLHCCCIYIGCKILGIKNVSKDILCKELNVHVHTLNKHEANIQHLLMSC